MPPAPSVGLSSGIDLDQQVFRRARLQPAGRRWKAWLRLCPTCERFGKSYRGGIALE